MKTAVSNDRWKGAAVILTIVGVAIVLSVVAWRFRYLQGRLALEFFGSPAANRIQHADQVELMYIQLAAVIGPESPPRNVETLEEGKFVVARSHEISAAPGLLHARHAFLVDANFDWDKKRTSEENWSIAMRFRDGKEETTMFIDMDNGFVRLAGRKKEAALSSAMRSSFEDYFERRLQGKASGDENR